MNPQSIYQLLIEIDGHPETLINLSEKNSELKEINEFMRKWFLYYENECQKNEYLYFWKLVHGWSIEQFANDQMITNVNTEEKRQIQYQKLPIQMLSPFSLEKINKSGDNFIQYLSKSEVIIKQEQSLIWINPSSVQQQIERRVVIVLTSANINNILSYLKMKEAFTTKIKLITTECIYRKIQMLAIFLNKVNINIDVQQCYMLKPEEYFQYNQILWLIRENSWYEPIYDLTLTVVDSKNAKTTFLVQNYKLEETKLIYYGWKKKYITQIRYQNYIRQWEKGVIQPQYNLYFFKIQAKIIRQKDKSGWYLSFCEKNIIKQLEDGERDQIYSCCELLEYISNQIIVKKGYIFDYVYILLEGNFYITETSGNFYKQGKIDINQIFGIQELKKDETNYSFTLKTISKAKILRIAKHNVKFILYDFLF